MAGRVEQHELAVRHPRMDIFADQLGAMMSSRHCRTSVRTSSLGRSARLSEKNVTRANCRAISGSVAQKLLVSSSPSSGRSGLPMIAGAIAADQPRWLSARNSSSSSTLGAEAADIVAVVDIAGEGPTMTRLCEQLRRLVAGERADHRADRMPDEHRVLQVRARARSRPRRRHSRRGCSISPDRRPRGRSGRRRHDRTGRR